jgi:hypothetical protein
VRARARERAYAQAHVHAPVLVQEKAMCWRCTADMVEAGHPVALSLFSLMVPLC